MNYFNAYDRGFSDGPGVGYSTREAADHQAALAAEYCSLIGVWRLKRKKELHND